MGSILCEHCTAACCRYLAIEIDKPRSRRDYDDIRWYLMHEGISIFVEEGSWFLQIETRCKNLGLDHRCQIYDVRPAICRDFEPGECDYAAGPPDYELHFTHACQLEEHYEQKTGKKLGVASEPPRIKAKSARRKKSACT